MKGGSDVKIHTFQYVQSGSDLGRSLVALGASHGDGAAKDAHYAWRSPQVGPQHGASRAAAKASWSQRGYRQADHRRATIQVGRRASKSWSLEADDRQARPYGDGW